MKLIQTYFGMMAAFVLIDALWLGVIAKDLYKKNIGHLMTENIVWGAAAVFYLLYLAGIIYFAVFPSHSLQKALISGALLGGLCYATYDLTNWATLKDWPWKVVAIDIVWGMAITALCAGVGYWIYK